MRGVRSISNALTIKGFADRLLGEWHNLVAAENVRDTRPGWARRYWRVRNRRAGITL